MTDLAVLFFVTVFANNVILTQFLGICPFLGVSKNMSSAMGMGAAVLFVTLISCVVTYPLEKLLIRYDIVYFRTILYILVIAALVELVELVIKRYMKGLYEALGVYLPLITTNCAVLGTAIKVVNCGYSFIEGIVYAIGVSAGFFVAMCIMAGIRENIDEENISEAFRGMPVTLITAGLMAIAFYGFMGVGR